MNNPRKLTDLMIWFAMNIKKIPPDRIQELEVCLEEIKQENSWSSDYSPLAPISVGA